MTRQRLIPYACALSAILIAYPLVYFFSGRQMLAVFVSAVGALLAFMVCRVVQTRGKVSLALTTIGLPLLVACGCVVVQRLSVFSDRQATADRLRAVGVTFRQSSPDLVGEWSIDKTGKTLPVWLVNRIGPDAMSPLRGVNANVEDLKGVSLQNIDTSLLSDVALRCEFAGSIDAELIDWLNGCDKLDRLSFNLSDFSKSDGESLSRLEKEWYATIHVNDDNVDLSNVGSPVHLYVEGAELTPRQARQLSGAVRPSTAYLALRLESLSSDVVKELTGLREDCYLTFERANLDEEAITEIAKLGLWNVQFSAATFTSAPGSMSFGAASVKTEYLRLHDCSMTIEDCIKLSHFFQCKGLTVVETLGKRLAEEEIERLWECERLEEVSCYGPPWKHYKNPRLEEEANDE